MRQTVTVIIPVYNAEKSLNEMLQALMEQTYPREKTEFIFVDNGSTDVSVSIIRNYPVTLLFSEGDKNPYLARNKALETAKGDIIAFTDANKIPAKNWIEAGADALEKNRAGLAGGNIRFKIGAQPSASEIYDSITFNNNKVLTEKEKAAATGNLFVKRKIFETLGGFPGSKRSGMDVWWTQNAVKHGYFLIFAEQAVVYCIPRNFTQVLKKSYRVGKSHPFNMKNAGMSSAGIFVTSLKTFAPPKISTLKKQVMEQGSDVSFLRIWCIAWASKIWMGAGRLRGLFMMNETIKESNP